MPNKRIFWLASLFLSSIAFIFIIAIPCRSQNIFSALKMKENLEYKTARPKKIIQTNIYYSPNGRKITKEVKTFDNSGMLLTEERFDENGNKEASLTYRNDTTRKLILSRALEQWTSIGYMQETAYYKYDTLNYLVGIIDKNKDGKIIRETTIINNEDGNPIELEVFENGRSYGKELGVYLNDRNKVISTVISNTGQQIYKDTFSISFLRAHMFPNNNESFNLNGDLIKWTSRNLNGSQTMFESEYTYDSFGNITEIKRYKVFQKSNGKIKRELENILKREYTY